MGQLSTAFTKLMIMNNKSDKLYILICELFLKEANAVIDSEQYADVEVVAFPARCGQPHIKENELASITNSIDNKSQVSIIGSCCLADLKESSAELKNCQLHLVDQCFYLFTNPSMIDDYTKQGAYLITPGWLIRWKLMIDRWGFDKKTAQDFFSEFCKKLILLDTGVEKNIPCHLEDFSGFVNRPFEVVPVCLDFFALYINKIVMAWQQKKMQSESDAILSVTRKQMADYSMAFDLISKLNQSFTETEIIDKIKEIFTILFAPKELFYMPVIDGKPETLHTMSDSKFDSTLMQNKLLNLTKKYNWTESEKGFIMRIAYQDEITGVILIDQIQFTEYKRHYLNLALYIVEVCGLAIANARTFQKIKQAEAKLVMQVLDMFYMSGDDEGKIIHNIIQQLKDFSGFDAIAIRLREGDNFPYYASTGFSEEFINEANNMFVQSRENRTIVDEKAKPVLGCICGMVLSDHTAPIKSFYTEHGSFFTNDFSGFQSMIKENGLKLVLHNHCKNDGFESIALIPLHSEQDILGVLQLNDHRPGMITPYLVAFYEVIATSIATIIKRKEAEDSLKESESRYIDLYDNAPDLYISVYAETGRIRQCNQAVANELGYSKEEIVGQPVTFLYHPDCMEEMERVFLTFITTGELHDEELQLKRKNGTKLHVSLNASSVRDKNGKILYIAGPSGVTLQNANWQRKRYKR